MRNAVVACATFAFVLAGCNWGWQSAHAPGASLSIQFASRPQTSWMNGSREPGGRAYLASFYTASIVVYDRRGVVLGAIHDPNYPVSLSVDRGHNLWLIDTRTAKILEYARDATKPKATLTDPETHAVDVTRCPGGAVYVSNSGVRSGRRENVEVYASGSTSPTGQLHAGHHDNPVVGLSITCDAAGTVFWLVEDNGIHFEIFAFPHGMQTSAYSFGVPLKQYSVCGIKADPAGNLLVCDRESQTITEYSEQGEPTGRSITTYVLGSLAVSADGRVVGGYDDSNFNGASLWTFPGGELRRQYRAPSSGTLQNVTGFALDPDE